MRWMWLTVLVVSIAAAEDRPRLEPLAGSPAHPAGNLGTVEKIKLGEMLFFETLLSGGNRRSCSTCHKPAMLFMDGLSRAWGLHDMELRRKTPGLLNVGWQRSLFSDGRAKTLEEQASKPLENHLEMDIDPEEAAEKIRRDPAYAQLFEKVFPGEAITFDLIAKAIAAYERTLVSYDSDLDRYLLGDETALKPEAVRGMKLFEGKAGCIRCHHGPLLTDHQFHYTGVPEISGGTPDGTKHKTQSLRDAYRRSSYMHNGHFLKLRHVIEHYERGGSAPAGIPTEIEPLELSEEDKSDLVAFLLALNGRTTTTTTDPPGSSDISNAPPPKTAEGPAQDPAYLKRPR